MGTVFALFLLGGSPALPASQCNATCYTAKSVDYQRCRQIPAADRAARTACFQRADRALQQCLRRCR
jgi:hypothetical protein